MKRKRSLLRSGSLLFALMLGGVGVVGADDPVDLGSPIILVDGTTVTVASGGGAAPTGSDNEVLTDGGDGTIVSESGLLFDSVKLTVDPAQTFGSTTGYCWGDGDTCFYESADDKLVIDLGGILHYLVSPEAGSLGLGLQVFQAWTAGGSDNVAFGPLVLKGVTTGDQNTGVGASALDAVTTGIGNTGLGNSAGSSLSTVNHNTYVGSNSGGLNTGGANTAVGAGTLQSAGAGAFNVVIGYLTGTTITSGSRNIIIGNDVEPTSGTANDELNIGGVITSTDMTTGDITIANDLALGGTVDGRDVATDGTKLDGIESSATADQTNAEIKTAYEANADTNEFSDAEQTKLAGLGLIGASPAATCTAGSFFIDTDESDDTNCTTTADNSLCLCIATDTWVALENN